MSNSPSLTQTDNDITQEPTPPLSTSSIDDFQRKVLLAMEQEQQHLSSDLTSAPSTSFPTPKEDSKFDEIKTILGSTIIQNLNDSKWEQKKQGLTSINNFLLSDSSPPYNPVDLFLYIKHKLKDFKETNFNIIKEALLVFTTLASQKQLDKDNCISIINAYYEKIADIKLKDQLNLFISNCIDSIIKVDVFIRNILGKINKKNNVKVIIEYSILFSKLVEDFDIDSLPIKEMVELCKTMAANSNPQMRSSATNFLCVIYKYVGDDLKFLIKDIKESTLKVIESELEKVEVVVIKKNKTNTSVKVNNNESNNKDEYSNDIINNELLPRVDISKKITAQMLKDIKDGKWLEKKEACEYIEKLLSDSNYKILPDGLNDLLKLITTKLSDGNKNLVKMCISLVSKFIRSLGNNFTKYSKQFALALLPNLSDKMPTLRDECQNCLDIWVTHLGIENIVMFIPSFMKNNNFDSRTESFKFLFRHIDKLTKSIGENLFKEMIDPLLLCMQDKSSSIRSSSEEMILLSTKYIDINLYYNSLKSFKPVIENDLRESLNRIQNENEGNNYASMNIPIFDKEIPRSNRTNTNHSVEKPHSHIETHVRQKNKRLTNPNSIKVLKKNKPQQLSNEDLLNKSSTNNNDNQKTINTVSPFIKAPPTHINANSNVIKQYNPHSHLKKPTSALLRKYNNINNANPRCQIFISNINVKPSKEKRIEFDKKFKFSLETLPNDENKIKDQLKNLFTEEFIKKSFSDEFKNVVESINTLKSIIDTQKEGIVIILDHLDLILKMISIKYNTNINPSMLKAFFEFLDSLYQTIISNTYKLNDTEINIILPLLVSKLSLSNTALKEHLVFLLHNYITLIGTNKSMLIILNSCLNKNVKIKSEVLDITTDLYLNDRIDICNKVYIKSFTKFLSVNNTIVKTKAVNLFKEIYSNIGDELWMHINISQKEKDFLEENLFQEEEFGEEEEEEEEEFEYDDGNKYEENEQELINSKNYKSNVPLNNVRPNMNNSVVYEISNKDREIFMSNYGSNNMNIHNTCVCLNSNNNVVTKVKKITVQQQPRNSNNNKPTTNKNIYINNNTKNVNTSNLETQASNLNSTGTLQNKNELVNCLKNLLIDDLTEKVNAIIIIHEVLCPKYEENKSILISNIDIIITIFVEAMRSLFSVPNITDIPIKFAKYLATVLCKIATNKDLISHITYSVLFELIEELLSDLLIDKLDKVGTNQEGNIIFKSLNSTMLRLLENCDGTNVIVSLLELIRRYRINNQKNKISSLAIKCILKVNQNLENLINELEFNRILLQIHLLIIDIEKNSGDMYPKDQIDQVVIKYIKNLIHEMVKKKNFAIMDDYNKGIRNHPIPDKYIIEWIQNYLEVMGNVNQNRIEIQKNNNNEKDKGNVNRNMMMPKGGKGVSSYQRTNVIIQGDGNNGNSQQGFGTTIFELKKKWNDANNKKSGGAKKK